MAEPVLIVEIAPASTPLQVSSVSWINISADVHGLEIHRGFGSELDTVAEAGTATITLNGANRKYDPTYASNISPGNLVPGKQVRVRATWAGATYNIFKGHIESWPQEYTKGAGKDIIEVQLACVDGTQYLANAVLENDAVLTSPGKKVFHSKRRKLGGFHQWTTRGSEGKARTVETSEYSDLIEYSKPWAYWPISGTDADETAEDVGGGNDLVRDPATSSATSKVEHLGSAERVLGDVYPASSLWMTGNLGGHYQTRGVEVPQFHALTVECVFSFIDLPSSTTFPARLVSGPMDSGGVGPIFTLYFDTADDLNARVRLTNNTNYTWTLAEAPAVNTTYTAALVYDSAAGTIGAYFNGVGGSGATAAGDIPLDDPGANRNIFIGGHPGAAAYQGPHVRIQHIAIYNRVLTTTTLLAHKNAIPLGFANGQATDTRVGAVLSAVSWPASWEEFATGTYQTLIGRRYSNQSALDEIRETVAAEFGRFWFDGLGMAQLEIRDWRNLSFFASSAATFGDAGGELPYYGIGQLGRNDSTKVSRVLCKSAADEAVQMNEDAAISPPVTLDLGEVILDNAASASSLCSDLVTRYKTPKNRIDEITVRPAASPDALWPIVLGFDLLRQITIKRRPLGSGDTAISQASHIEQLDHSVSFRGAGAGMNSWETTWTVSPR